MTTTREALELLVRSVPPGAAVTVPASWVAELLGDAPVSSPPDPVLIDLTVVQVAERLGRRPSTVRQWAEAGLLEGAYKLRGREWRVPPAALAAFQERERQRMDSHPASPGDREPRNRWSWRQHVRPAPAER